MNNHNNCQNGFINILALLVLATFIGAFIYFVVLPETNKQRGADQSALSFQKAGLFGQLCQGKGTFKLKTFPLDVKNIELITPMGKVQDSHVTPTDHQYIIPVGTKSSSLITNNPKQYQIKAPADGYIISVELFREPVEQAYRSQLYSDNYLVIFEHSCDFYTRLIHIDTLSDKILASVKFKNPESQHPYASPRIKVKEGEVIGTVGPHSFDFQIMNAKTKNSNLISPQNIDYFSAYTVDTFDYLAEPLRSELLKKNLIKHKPFGGKIGYDVKEKLAGNWFLVGRDKQEREEYWTKNLSVTYDHIDPTQIRLSFGNFSAYPKAFGARGNAPDPKVIEEKTGLVKYELVTFDYYSEGQKWDALHFLPNLTAKNSDEVLGVALFQLLPDGKLKVETFPGKTSSSVTSFTSTARLYER
ncbi:MAG: hypothetical protein A3G47_03460 [Candidatus Zambryskibacteria bacterium RIFCSPLOWO2_12_FULL_39_45]|uniref:Peptidase M23 domain-containing protein n=3 Tax=Candidatus Zambryskiibacteriota TaxID=1817925 RepID=A0A1G2TB36_9BACT|nr:MAG: hypothetical protein UT81_C0010G0030 [Parcubacteria group bacterium GW2011_GWA2_40_14]OHA93821.1 MAG: hypothetical protein A2W58_00170 [Candidatus Zambryskibacteria bacterium RIFCSPHIGHO2_02_38_10.5]OHA97514.1 MAG: hypothetical protein A3E32_00855 [Candidatus Zambryskibacteria bacterium RIFCSPHIGHO2_12_FULL_38_37]OHB07499.1 MAG: hypothetical protein A2W64_03910 [Candidatus Zambryskibacteria bacterium RIFCSPLOWO2_02_39_10]OHB09750.1 MAG: hypothetical protein A3I21_01125 [Candidatus Zambr